MASASVARYRPIGVRIVGLSAGGGWAATAHVPALAGLDGYELRALFGNPEDLARCDDVDLVAVTVKVPPPWRAHPSGSVVRGTGRAAFYPCAGRSTRSRGCTPTAASATGATAS
ncbi:hypothetical protein Pme01_28270 [Planosporangium mesophilum]|uniref:Gfo/Idh/MocA-like oxidoreductase N-terminal domain-containing protein n=1 Tax=Planosporangium mesophilum TaxID=689768 RepID=A0A8J3T9U7_9ACTN|nr:hypothetical protein Pme01_28270 [Planosporangium mesophilum]